jgi:serine/threonine protein kinase
MAEDLWLPDNPRCVVKKLQPQSNERFILETARRLFTREANVLYRLSEYPQIPRLLAHLEVEEQFYLVQEFIEGQDLGQAEIVPGKRWSEEEVISFLQEVLEILAFVHQNGVIHRDIKPSNLIRHIDDGKIVLIDFGAVKEIANITLTEGEGRLLTVAVGTPGYVPQEQYKGYPRFNSDIYALGMTAIQAITGFPPNQLPRDYQTGEISWRNISSHCSSSLASILDKMVRNDFRERYQNANEVIEDLQKLIGNNESKSFVTKIISFNSLRQRKARFWFWFAILPLALGIIILNLKIWNTFQALNYYEQDNTLIKKGEYQQVLPEKLTLITAAREEDKKKMYNRLSEFLVAEQWRGADEQTWELIKQIAVRDGNYGGISFSELESLSCSDLSTIDKLWLQHSHGHFGFSVQKQIYESLAGKKLNADIVAFQSFALKVGWKEDTNYTEKEQKRYSDLTFSLNSPRGHLPALSSLFWDYQLGVSDLSRAGHHERFSSLVLRLKTCNI